MKNIRFLWLLLIAFLPALSAAEPRPRTFRVICLGGIQTDFLYDNGREKGLQIHGALDSFSKSCTAPSGGVLSLYRVIAPPANAPAGTSPTKQTLAEIAYPKDPTRAIVLLYPGATNAPFPISGMVVDDSFEGHKAGKARVLNLSAHPIAFAAPDQMEQVQPRSLQMVVPFTPGNCHVKVAANIGGAWRPVMEMERNLSPNVRLFVLLVDATSVNDGPPISCTLLYDFLRPRPTFVTQNAASPQGG